MKYKIAIEQGSIVVRTKEGWLVTKIEDTGKYQDLQLILDAIKSYEENHLTPILITNRMRV